MLKNNSFTTLTALALGLLALAGCPVKDAMPDDAGDSMPSVDSGPASTPDASTPDMSAPGKPLAYGCSAGAECASGFCVDGVCCDSACDQQCAICNLTGAAGHCTGQLSGDDTGAAVPCEGAKTCGIDLSSPTLAGCKLRNQQRCSLATDCASLNCIAFYEDIDGDGYGSGNTLKLCEVAGAAAPPGYSKISGDCCDQDHNAHPGQTSYFKYANGCGWDFNCSGKIETSPPGYASASCGNYVSTCDSCQELVTCH